MSGSRDVLQQAVCCKSSPTTLLYAGPVNAESVHRLPFLYA